MRLLLLLVLALALVGCSSVDGYRSEGDLASRYDQGPAEPPARFMGGLQDAALMHVGDCLVGLDFFLRSVSTNTRRDWDRTVAFFR